jgi:hypothetical protein
MKNGIDIDREGNRFWLKDGRLHRLEGPAAEYADGSRAWWAEDQFLGYGASGFWALWDLLTDEQRSNLNLLVHLPGAQR